MPEPFDPGNAGCTPTFTQYPFYVGQDKVAGESYRPRIVMPSKLLHLDPAWAHCGFDEFQGIDPPKALTPQKAMDPATTHWDPAPVATPPSPGSSLLTQPLRTAAPSNPKPEEPSKPVPGPLEAVPSPTQTSQVDPSTPASQGSAGDPPANSQSNDMPKPDPNVSDVALKPQEGPPQQAGKQHDDPAVSHKQSVNTVSQSANEQNGASASQNRGEHPQGGSSPSSATPGRPQQGDHSFSSPSSASQSSTSQLPIFKALESLGKQSLSTSKSLTSDSPQLKSAGTSTQLASVSVSQPSASQPNTSQTTTSQPTTSQPTTSQPPIFKVLESLGSQSLSINKSPASDSHQPDPASASTHSIPVSESQQHQNANPQPTTSQTSISKVLESLGEQSLSLSKFPTPDSPDPDFATANPSTTTHSTSISESQQHQTTNPAFVVDGQTLTHNGAPITISGKPIVYSSGSIYVGSTAAGVALPLSSLGKPEEWKSLFPHETEKSTLAIQLQTLTSNGVPVINTDIILHSPDSTDPTTSNTRTATISTTKTAHLPNSTPTNTTTTITVSPFPSQHTTQSAMLIAGMTFSPISPISPIPSSLASLTTPQPPQSQSTSPQTSPSDPASGLGAAIVSGLAPRPGKASYSGPLAVGEGVRPRVKISRLVVGVGVWGFVWLGVGVLI